MHKGGRPPLEEGKKAVSMSVYLLHDHLIYARKKGGSAWVRKLIEREINEANVQSGLAGVSAVQVVAPSTSR
jgi:hypothetical protein